MNYCIDCKHYLQKPPYKVLGLFTITPARGDGQCGHADNADPVTGQPRHDCGYERMFTTPIHVCGSGGVLFEARP